MFLVNNLFTLISLVIIIIICIQLIDFISNYDYIVRYVRKFSKWEFVRSPNLNVIDRSVFDPNTDETDKRRKWRCISAGNSWIAARDGSVQVDSNGPLYFNNFEDCNRQLFSNPIITQDTPLPGSKEHDYLRFYDWDS